MESNKEIQNKTNNKNQNKIKENDHESLNDLIINSTYKINIVDNKTNSVTNYNKNYYNYFYVSNKD